MTVKELINNALQRIGVSLQNGSEELYKEINQKALPIINDIYFDIYTKVNDSFFKELKTLSDTIDLPQGAMITLLNGVCAGLCLVINDTEKYSFFSSLYQSGRLKLTKICQRKDVL